MKSLSLASLTVAALVSATSLAPLPAAAVEYHRVVRPVAAPGPVYVHRHRRGGGIGPGGAAALGVLGGVAVGAAIAGAARAAPVVVAPEPVPVVVERAPRRVYVEEAPEECVTERRRVWVPGYGWETRRRTTCE